MLTVKALRKAVGTLRRAVDQRKGVVPSAQRVRIAAGPNGLRMTVQARAGGWLVFSALGDFYPCDAVVDVHQLWTTLKGIKGGLIEMSVAGNALHCISTERADPFPVVLRPAGPVVVPTQKQDPWVSLPREALAYVARAARRGDLYRPHINGVYFDADRGCAVATDGHRLHQVLLAGPMFMGLCPVALVDWALETGADPVNLRQTESHAVLRVGAWTRIAPLGPAADFPPYERLLGAYDEPVEQVAVDVLRGAIGAFLPAGEVELRKQGGMLTLRQHGGSADDAGTKVATCPPNHIPRSVLVDPQLLLDALPAAGTVDVFLRHAAEGVVLRGANTVAVVMPLRW